MLLVLLIGCATALAAWALKVSLRAGRQDELERRLLGQAQDYIKAAAPAVKPPLVSSRAAELEGLLLKLRTAADSLTTALSAEAVGGRHFDADDQGQDAVLLERYSMARAAVHQAEEDYNEALTKFREFLHSLPPNLRAKAAAQGATAMVFGGAWA